jgi:hypothetical protein
MIKIETFLKEISLNALAMSKITKALKSEHQTIKTKSVA